MPQEHGFPTASVRERRDARDRTTIEPARAPSHALEPLEVRALLSNGFFPIRDISGSGGTNGPTVVVTGNGGNGVVTPVAGNGVITPVTGNGADGQAEPPDQVMRIPTFEQARFDAPVQNVYFPLVPGTTFVYEARTEEGLERNEVTVTRLATVVNGVTVTVLRDVETIIDPELGRALLLEDTLDFVALDNQGNVWYFGEASTAFEYDEQGNLIETSTEGSWLAGVDDAEPGILVLADPQVGDVHQQENAPDVAEDRARVLATDATVTTGLGTFTNVLVTEETTPLEPDVREQKFYAPGVGLVLTDEITEETRVELVDIISADDGGVTGDDVVRAPGQSETFMPIN